MPHRKSTCIYRRFLRLVPRIFKTDPWQTMICLAWVGLGIGTALAMLFPTATSVVDQPLGWLLLRGLWSACFALGGGLQLWSLQWPHDGAMERLGISLAGVACGTYALALLASGAPAGFSLGGVFLVIAFGHLVVLIAAEVSRRYANRALSEG